jgi:hypothetical protein
MHFRHARPVAGLLAAMMLTPLAGCGSNTIRAESPPGQPPMSQNRPMPMPETQRPGMTTKQKVLLLAGAAAVYYLYKKHQNRQGHGPEGKYFMSKNGRVYYRNLKTGEYKWVDPPKQPISVPADEYERYTGRNYADTGDHVIRDAPADWPGSRAYGTARAY